MSNTPPNVPLTPEQINRLVEKSVLLRQGERMILMEDARANLAMTREAARASLDLPPKPISNAAEDPMILGDIHYNSQAPAASNGIAAPLAWLLGPVLGAGLAWAIPWLVGLANDHAMPDPSAPATPVVQESDGEEFRYQIGIHREQTAARE